MLSRVADAFYWTGRYLERAEHTARLVDVNTYLSLDSTPESSGRHWHRVFDSLQATMVDGGTSDVVALVHQLTLEVQVVLDDAVVNNHDPAGAVTVRVGVFLGRTTVRGPPRVADAILAVDRLLEQDVFEFRQLPRTASNLHHAMTHDRHTGRVVAAILEAAQPFDQDRQERLLTDVADNPAHA